MKILAAIAIVAAAVVGLSACGSSEQRPAGLHGCDGPNAPDYTIVCSSTKAAAAMAKRYCEHSTTDPVDVGFRFKLSDDQDAARDACVEVRFYEKRVKETLGG
jgi:hypothetical protein